MSPLKSIVRALVVVLAVFSLVGCAVFQSISGITVNERPIEPVKSLLVVYRQSQMENQAGAGNVVVFAEEFSRNLVRVLASDGMKVGFLKTKALSLKAPIDDARDYAKSEGIGPWILLVQVNSLSISTIGVRFSLDMKIVNAESQKEIGSGFSVGLAVRPTGFVPPEAFLTSATSDSAAEASNKFLMKLRQSKLF